MKKNTKRVLALIAATVMSCTMVTGFANTASITKVEVLNTDGTDVLWSYDSAVLETNPTINATSENLVKVYTKITDDNSAGVANVESTFLSHLVEAENLGDTNIQFVDQKTTSAAEGEEGTAVYTFRPRTGYEGTYVAKTGGEGVATAVSENYTVGSANVQWSLVGENNNVEIGSEVNLVFNFDLPANAVMPVALTSVKVGDADAAYTYDAGAKTLTLIAGYPAAAGTTYTVTVVAENYATVTADYVVKEEEKEDVTIEEGDEAVVEEGVKDAADAIVGAEMTDDAVNGKLSISYDPVKIGNADNSVADKYEVKYSVDGDNVSIANNQITWDYKTSGKFAQRAVVKVSVDDEVQEKDIYFIKPGTTVSFGNATAIAAADGTDAFASQDKLKEVTDTDATYLCAKALNIILNGQNAENVAQFSNSLDFNGEDGFVLAEYYIIKRMLEERGTATDNDVYSVYNVGVQRANLNK